MVTTSLGASHFMSLDTDIITVIDLLNTVRINKNQPKKKNMISKIRQGNQRMEMSNDCLWRSRCRHWIESSHFSIKTIRSDTLLLRYLMMSELNCYNWFLHFIYSRSMKLSSIANIMTIFEIQWFNEFYSQICEIILEKKLYVTSAVTQFKFITILYICFNLSFASGDLETEYKIQ